MAGIYPQDCYSSLEDLVRIMKLANGALVGAGGFC